MANRVPLIVDSTTLNIKELPSGDNLDLSNSGIHNAGVITATKFVGDIEGNIVGSATSITVADESTDTSCNVVFVTAATGQLPPKTSSGLTYDSANNNVTIGGSLTVANNISIGGTIQYQDVTNVESLGIITARKGINIGPADAGGYGTGIGATFSHVGDFITVGVTTLTDLRIGNANSIDIIRDEDNMASNDVNALATQQSIKAYVDGSAPTGSNLAVSADSGSNESINLATEVLDIEGTSNEIETATGTNKVVIGLPNNVTIGNQLTVTGLTKTRTGINIGPSDAGGYGTGIGATFTHAGDFITVGVSTFQGNIDANGNLDVDGQTDLDVLNVSDTATFSADVTFTGAANNVVWDKSDNSLEFADDAKATFGTVPDLEIYHAAGGDSIIHHTATSGSSLRLRSRGFTFKNQANNATIATFNEGDACTLFQNGNARVTTTSDGTDIGGTGSLKVPVGTTAQRSSSPTDGDFRYNSTENEFEGYSDGAWGAIGGGASETDTSVSTTSATAVYTVAHASYRSVSLIMQITQGTAYQSGRYMVIHDGTTATIVEESAVATGSMLGTFTAGIDGSNLKVYVNMTSASSATVTVIPTPVTV